MQSHYTLEGTSMGIILKEPTSMGTIALEEAILD
jgi:hypothetical protein